MGARPLCLTSGRVFPTGLSSSIAGTAAVFLLCLLPVALFPVLPTVDFYAHALRYDILAAAGSDPDYATNYRSAWKLLPNLGLDLIGTGLFAAFPHFVASRILLMIVVAAPMAGIMVLAWCLRGQINALTVALAGISAHSFILGWGFANFLLGFGMALAGLGLWIATDRRPVRQLLFAVPVATAIFMTHGFVFALWGMMLFVLEAAATIRGGRLCLADLGLRTLRLFLVALLPVLLFLSTDTFQGPRAVTVAFANIAAYSEEGRLFARVLEEIWIRIDSVLRVSESNWPVWDRLFGLVLWGLLGLGLFTRRFRIDRCLWPVLGLLAVIAMIVPPSMFGVGHLPERLPLCILAVIAAGLAPGPDRSGPPLLGRILVMLLPLHLAMVTLGWARERQGYADFLELAHTLPKGGLGSVAYAPGAQPRDEMRSCKPLTFLLAMERGIGVPTFANPTQQPLEIVGPLAAALAEYARAPDLEGAAQVRAMMEAGFDFVVLCEGRHVSAAEGGRPVEGAVVIGAGRGWTLYRKLRG